MKVKWLWLHIFYLLFAYPVALWAEMNYGFTESGINTDPSDWPGADENQVFYKKLMHSEKDNSWVIKIGKGGQIYSIKDPRVG